MTGKISGLPSDLVAKIAGYDARAGMIVAQAIDKKNKSQAVNSKVTLAVNQAKKGIISEWEKNFSADQIKERDRFYSSLKHGEYLEIRNGKLVATNIAPNYRRFSWYQIHSKVPQYELMQAYNAERKTIQNIMEGIQVNSTEDLKRYNQRKEFYLSKLNIFHDNLYRSMITQEIPLFFKVVFTIYDVVKNLFFKKAETNLTAIPVSLERKLKFPSQLFENVFVELNEKKQNWFYLTKGSFFLKVLFKMENNLLIIDHFFLKNFYNVSVPLNGGHQQFAELDSPLVDLAIDLSERLNVKVHLRAVSAIDSKVFYDRGLELINIPDEEGHSHAFFIVDAAKHKREKSFFSEDSLFWTDPQMVELKGQIEGRRPIS